jgi:hypothetical protein
MMARVNSTMIYCKNFCKCHNAPQYANNIIKGKLFWSLLWPNGPFPSLKLLVFFKVLFHLHSGLPHFLLSLVTSFILMIPTSISPTHIIVLISQTFPFISRCLNLTYPNWTFHSPHTTKTALFYCPPSEIGASPTQLTKRKPAFHSQLLALFYLS